MNKKNILLTLSLLYSFGLYSAEAAESQSKVLDMQTVRWDNSREIIHTLVAGIYITKEVKLWLYSSDNMRQRSKLCRAPQLLHLTHEGLAHYSVGIITPTESESGQKSLEVIILGSNTDRTRFALGFAQCKLVGDTCSPDEEMTIITSDLTGNSIHRLFGASSQPDAVRRNFGNLKAKFERSDQE